MKAGAVLLAAGKSERMGENKMLLPLCGRTVLERSFLTLASCKDIERIVFVASQETRAACEALAAGSATPCAVVMGGEERQDSVLNGLRVLGRAEIAVIHDGARCLATKELIEASIESAGRFGSGVAAVPATDTIKRAGEDRVVTETLDRRVLWQMQTPQTFRYADILEAYESAAMRGVCATDDAALLEAGGREVRLVLGSRDNLKITTPEDVELARALLAKREGGLPMRTGCGYDVHQLAAGRKLVLGGVEIPYEKGLLGHSDADVLTHAVMDALLGAAALGDIGQLFPDTDPAYEGANSLELLAQVAALLKEKGFAVGNVDATVAAERPKLLPYEPAMRQNLARVLGILPERVSVKATTTEGLGIVGEGRGMAAQCVCTVF